MKPYLRTMVVRLAGLFIAAIVLHSAIASAAEPKILAFGDSLTAGFGLPSSEAFSVCLEAKLQQMGVAARVTNAGVSGDTTAGGLARLASALADKPDLVILELGANDMLRGVEPATVRANLEAMIGQIRTSGAKLLIAGMHAIPNWGDDYQHEFDRIYPELAMTGGVTLYPFFLEGVATDPALNQPDGRHPNARGVAVIVDRIAPVVAKMLGET